MAKRQSIYIEGFAHKVLDPLPTLDVHSRLK